MKLLQQAARPAGGATPPAGSTAAITTTTTTPAQPAIATGAPSRVYPTAIVSAGAGPVSTAPGSVPAVAVQGTAQVAVNVPLGRAADFYISGGAVVRGLVSTNANTGVLTGVMAGGRGEIGLRIHPSRSFAARIFVGTDVMGHLGDSQTTAGGPAGTTSFAGALGGVAVTPFAGVSVDLEATRGVSIGARYEYQPDFVGSVGDRTLPSLTQAGATETQGVAAEGHIVGLEAEFGRAGSPVSAHSIERAEMANNRLFFSTAQPSAANLTLLQNAVAAFERDPSESNRAGAMRALGTVFLSEANPTLHIPYVDALTEAVTSLQERDGISNANGVVVHTYTDSQGSDARNLALATRRADAIALALRFVAKIRNFNMGNVSTNPHPESQRTFTNDTRSDQRALRRETGSQVTVDSGVLATRRVVNRAGVVTFYLGSETPPAAATPATPAAAPAAPATAPGAAPATRPARGPTVAGGS